MKSEIGKTKVLQQMHNHATSFHQREESRRVLQNMLDKTIIIPSSSPCMGISCCFGEKERWIVTFPCVFPETDSLTQKWWREKERNEVKHEDKLTAIYII